MKKQRRGEKPSSESTLRNPKHSLVWAEGEGFGASSVAVRAPGLTASVARKQTSGSRGRELVRIASFEHLISVLMHERDPCGCMLHAY